MTIIFFIIFLLAEGLGISGRDLEAKINARSNGAVYAVCMT